MRQRHYYYFGEELQEKMSRNTLDKDYWDYLRTSEKDGPFSIEKSIEDYEANCKKYDSFRNTAVNIIDLLNKYDLIKKRIVSLGAGKGILEWHLKNLRPDLNITCTDYTQEAMQRLIEVFPSVDEVRVYDMLNGDYSSFDKDAVLIMHRVSTEFDRDCWYNIFENIYKNGIEHIVFIPTELATFKQMINEGLNHFLNVVKKRQDVFCGWLYSEKEFLGFFDGKENAYSFRIIDKIKYNNTAIYLLERDNFNKG